MKNSLYIIFLAFIIHGCQEKSTDLVQLDKNPKTVELFAEGLITTGMYERDIAISIDGNEIVFTLSNYQQNARCLVSIKKQGDIWGSREILEFSGLYEDIEPFFSPDGKSLYFASNRPVNKDSTRTDYNIWVVAKTENEWKIPVPLNEKINTPGNEFYPSLSKTGNLYFTATREDGPGREDIFVSQFKNGKYQDPVPLDSGVNSEVYEFNAFINPEENLIIFSSYGRPDELGGGDLYYSKKDEIGNWIKARKFGRNINSSGLDYCPFVDYTHGNFYFTSDKTSELNKTFASIEDFINDANGTMNGMGNIYRISIDQLDLK